MGTRVSLSTSRIARPNVLALCRSQADSAMEAAVNQVKADLRARRQSTTLWRRPHVTLYVFARILMGYVNKALRYLLNHEPLMYGLLLGIVLLIGLIVTPGPHQAV